MAVSGRAALLWAASAVGLVWLAGPYWTWQLDDVFIVIAYAREWWTTGVLRWTSGEIVEGYSNFLFLAALTPIVGSGGDGGWWAKVLSFAGALGILAVLASILPRDRRGALVLAALIGWTPFCFWSILGMETPWFALLLGAGWASVAVGGRWWGLGVFLLALSSLTRPEGAAYLFLALAMRATEPFERRRSDLVAVIALLGVAAYHAWRVGHFGHVLPTPYLAKFSAVAPKTAGLEQWTREMATALGLLAVTFAVFRIEPRKVAWAVFPLALQSALLLRANGDWMGFARWLHPGVVALVVTVAAVGRPRELSTRTLFAIFAVLVPFAAVEPGARLQIRKTWALLHPIRQYQQGLGSAMPDDVEWVVHNVPWGATIFSGDVGMLGNVPGVRVRDIVGLVDREVAEFRASGRPFEPERDGLMYGTGPGRISFVRIPAGSETTPPGTLDPWMAEIFPYEAEPHTERYWVRWCIADDRKPSQDEVLLRWRALAAWYPTQPWIVWHRMLAEADAGIPVSSIEKGTSVRWDGDAFSGLPESLSFTRSSDSLTWSHPDGFLLRPGSWLTSRPVSAAEAGELRLVLRGEGAVEVSYEGHCVEAARHLSVGGVLELPLPSCGTAPLRVRVARVDEGGGALHVILAAADFDDE